MGLSGVGMQNGDNQSVVTGSLQSLNSDHKVGYTVSLFPYQDFTSETYYCPPSGLVMRYLAILFLAPIPQQSTPTENSREIG
jgi:hypothetical protein